MQEYNIFIAIGAIILITAGLTPIVNLLSIGVYETLLEGFKERKRRKKR